MQVGKLSSSDKDEFAPRRADLFQRLDGRGIHASVAGQRSIVVGGQRDKEHVICSRGEIRAPRTGPPPVRGTDLPPWLAGTTRGRGVLACVKSAACLPTRCHPSAFAGSNNCPWQVRRRANSATLAHNTRGAEEFPARAPAAQSARPLASPVTRHQAPICMCDAPARRPPRPPTISISRRASRGAALFWSLSK